MAKVLWTKDRLSLKRRKTARPPQKKAAVYVIRKLKFMTQLDIFNLLDYNAVRSNMEVLTCS